MSNPGEAFKSDLKVPHVPSLWAVPKSPALLASGHKLTYTRSQGWAWTRTWITCCYLHSGAASTRKTETAYCYCLPPISLISCPCQGSNALLLRLVFCFFCYVNKRKAEKVSQTFAEQCRSWLKMFSSVKKLQAAYRIFMLNTKKKKKLEKEKYWSNSTLNHLKYKSWSWLMRLSLLNLFTPLLHHSRVELCKAEAFGNIY